MINQGIARTQIVLHQDEFSKLVCFTTEEVIFLKGDNPCNCGSMSFLDKRLRHRFVLHD